MQIRSITMDAAGFAAAQVIQKNGTSIQPEGNLFGPSCKVTISQEGRNLSGQQAAQIQKSAQGTASVKEVKEQPRQVERTQSVETQKTQSDHQQEYDELWKSLEDMYKAEYSGDELREHIERFYEAICRYNDSQRGIQQVSVSFEAPPDEERAGQSKENLDKILKSLTPADLANATPLEFDYIATLPDMPENESLQ